jgi:hypothetical protein
MRRIRDNKISIGYAILGMIFTFIALAVGGHIITNDRISDEISKDNKKWCRTLTIIVQPGPDVPSPTPGTRAEAIQKELKNLKASYQCP